MVFKFPEQCNLSIEEYRIKVNKMYKCMIDISNTEIFIKSSDKDCINLTKGIN